MQWSRLFQPQNPIFWLLVVLNLLNAFLVVLLNSNRLSLPGLLTIASLAVTNALLSMWLTWRLLKTPDV